MRFSRTPPQPCRRAHCANRRNMAVRLTRSGCPREIGHPASVESARRFFQMHRYVRFQQLIEPELLERIAFELERGEFSERAHGTICVELCLPSHSMVAHI